MAANIHMKITPSKFAVKQIYAYLAIRGQVLPAVEFLWTGSRAGRWIWPHVEIGTLAVVTQSLLRNPKFSVPAFILPVGNGVPTS
jgi:hypothetical protein